MTKTTTNTMALVNETLTKDDVMSLLNETLERNRNINDYLSIIKGEYTTWDNEVHIGYIVRHHVKTATFETANDFMPVYVEQDDYYFMEVTLTEVQTSRDCHLYEPTFHKLMPITENYKRVPRFTEGSAKDLCNYIIGYVYRDKWDYIEVPMTERELKEARNRDWYWYRNHTTKVCPLTYSDIYCYWETPLTMEEQKQKDKKQRELEESLIARFNTGELPVAEDDAWYNVLSMGYGTSGYEFECKIIKILKNRGYSVRIDGERDSFGWVTRGIFVNNEMMCLI